MSNSLCLTASTLTITNKKKAIDAILCKLHFGKFCSKSIYTLIFPGHQGLRGLKAQDQKKDTPDVVLLENDYYLVSSTSPSSLREALGQCNVIALASIASNAIGTS